MTSRVLIGVTALALLASESPGQRVPGTGLPPPRAGDASRTRPTPPDVDLLGIRNIFRYGDEQTTADRSVDEGDAVEFETNETPPPAPAPVRVVGLVRRAGTLVVALAINGEVILLGAGESGSGFTVLGIGEEAVHLRGPDGEETLLELP
jgi:hypothetical protein